MKFIVTNTFYLVWLKKLLGLCRAFNRPVGILHVKVLRAMKLKKKDLLGASDPYVKLKLTENNLPSHKTSVKHKNLNPEWNEEFNIVVKDPESQALELLVYDWEKVYYFSLSIRSHMYCFNYVCLKHFIPYFRWANMKKWV